MLKSSWKMSWKYFSYFKLTREWHNPCSSVSQGSVGINQTFLFQPEYPSVIIIIICCSDHESWPHAWPLGAGHPPHPRHHWGLQLPPAAGGQEHLCKKQASCKNGWLCKKMEVLKTIDIVMSIVSWAAIWIAPSLRCCCVL